MKYLYNNSKFTKEDMVKAEDLGDYYRIPADNRDLNYDRYINKGTSRLDKVEEYNYESY